MKDAKLLVQGLYHKDEEEDIDGEEMTMAAVDDAKILNRAMLCGVNDV